MLVGKMEYPEQNQNQPYEVRPDLFKNLLVSVVKVVLALGLIAGVVLFFQKMGILQVFADLLAELGGITVSMDSVMPWLTIALLIVAGLVLFSAYLNVSAFWVELLPDLLRVHYRKALIAEDSKDIPYANIERVSVQKQGAFESMLGTSTLKLELTGMAEQEYLIPYVSNADEVVAKIQSLVQQAKMKQYYQYQENQRINTIMDQF
ncbi:PH domain-containing protein [Candidatus Woesearchaeota archaeon]|nr:MAG: PH domain-containing protein [Candidatus Woesearchaeota archaeon]